MAEKRKDAIGRNLRDGESQRQDGRYMYRYTDAGGQRRVVYSWKLVDTDQIPAGKRVERSLREMERSIMRDTMDKIDTYKSQNVTINQLFDAFLKDRPDLRETTRCNYICLYNSYLKDQIGNIPVGSLKSSTIKLMYKTMAEEYASSTIRSVHAILCQVLDMAEDDDLIRKNPAKIAAKKCKNELYVESKRRNALTVDEQESFIRYVYASKKYKRLGPLFTVLLGTGMRIGEALGLRWEDCDFKNKVIHVTHTMLYKPTEQSGCSYRISEPKTKAAIRDIPMMDGVLMALKALKKGRPQSDFCVDGYTHFIFLNSAGKVFTPAFVFDAINNIVFDHNKDETRLSKTSGKPPIIIPKISAHIFRHTFCTRLCEVEQDLKVVQEIMGHKNISTTMEVYNEATAERKKNGIKRMEGIVVSIA